MERRLTDEQMDELKDVLRGTCHSLIWGLAQLEIDEEHMDEAADRLLDGPMGLELCGECEWWHDTCDLVFDETRQAGICEQCDPDLHDH